MMKCFTTFLLVLLGFSRFADSKFRGSWGRVFYRMSDVRLQIPNVHKAAKGHARLHVLSAICCFIRISRGCVQPHWDSIERMKQGFVKTVAACPLYKAYLGVI